MNPLERENTYDVEDFYRQKYNLMLKYIDIVKNIKNIDQEQTNELKELFAKIINSCLEDFSMVKAIKNGWKLENLIDQYKKEGLVNFSINKCYKFIYDLYFSDKMLSIYQIDENNINTSNLIFIPKNTEPLCLLAYLNKLKYIDLGYQKDRSISDLNDYNLYDFNVDHKKTLEYIIDDVKIGYFMKYYILDVLYLFLTNVYKQTYLEETRNMIKFFYDMHPDEKNKLKIYSSLVPKDYYEKAREDLIRQYLWQNYLELEDAIDEINEMITPEDVESYAIASYPLFFILNKEIENDVGIWSNRFSRNL